MKKPNRSVINIKRKDAQPVDPSVKKAVRVANLPWDKIKHLFDKKKPPQPPAD